MIENQIQSSEQSNRGGLRAKVIVTVIEVRGSAPREAGAQLVVYSECEVGTIGGGSMEHQAVKKAKVIINKFDSRQASQSCFNELLYTDLDPENDQCCGGRVVLLFEYVPALADRKSQQKINQIRNQQAVVCLIRKAKFDQGISAELSVFSGDELKSEEYVANGELRQAFDVARETLLHSGSALNQQRLVAIEDDEYWVVSLIQPCDFNITLFGAGHIGRALTNVLSDYPCKINWVDNRPGIFPAKTEQNVHCINSSAPAAEIGDAPPGSYFLVMTHSHALDFELCDHILARDDFAFLGLIGSKSKAKRFKNQFAKRGLSRSEINRITCPIGIEGINSKHATAIAVSVAAQLLSLHHACTQNTSTENIRLQSIASANLS